MSDDEKATVPAGYKEEQKQRADQFRRELALQLATGITVAMVNEQLLSVGSVARVTLVNARRFAGWLETGQDPDAR